MKFLRIMIAMCAISLVATASASAATPFGKTFAPTIGTLPSDITFAAAAADGSNAAPVSGVITSFSHHAEDTPEAWVRLIVLRPTGTGFQVVAASEQQTLLASVLGVWPTRIPVQKGDVIGVFGPSADIAGAHQTNNPGDVIAGVSAAIDIFIGTNLAASDFTTYPGYALDIAASIEADADNDGFGDETQDQCPSKPALQTFCDVTAPTAKFKKPKIKRGASALTFKVTPSENATLKVSGTFKAGGKKFKIKALTVSVTPRGRTIKVSLPKKAKTALKNGKTLKGSLSIALNDFSGNASRYKLSGTIKPKN